MWRGDELSSSSQTRVSKFEIWLACDGVVLNSVNFAGESDRLKSKRFRPLVLGIPSRWGSSRGLRRLSSRWLELRRIKRQVLLILLF